MSKKYPLLDDKAWLYQKYWGEELSIHKIAQIVGCSDHAVWCALLRFYIPRRTYSESVKGEKHPLYGKHRSEETKEKIREGHKGEKCYWYGKHRSDATKQKLSEASQGEKNGNFGRHASEETRQKMREARKHRIYPTHHTKPEMIFETFCKKNNLPFKYTGDGAFWIGKGKDALNPDFMHLTRKVVVEIFSWFHDELRNRHVRPKGRYEDRKKIFKRYGYKMIVFWQDDLDREDAEKRILSVLKRHKI